MLGRVLSGKREKREATQTLNKQLIVSGVWGASCKKTGGSGSQTMVDSAFALKNLEWLLWAWEARVGPSAIGCYE